jgi:hypothetical protein
VQKVQYHYKHPAPDADNENGNDNEEDEAFSSPFDGSRISIRDRSRRRKYVSHHVKKVRVAANTEPEENAGNKVLGREDQGERGRR